MRRTPRSPRRSTLSWVLLVGALVLGVAGMHTLSGACEPSATTATASSHHGGTSHAGSDDGSHEAGSAGSGMDGMGVLGLCLAVLTAAAVLLLVLTGRRPDRGWVPRASVRTVVRPLLPRLPRPPDLLALSVMRC